MGRVSRASAAGRTFSNRTPKAGWAARWLHTSVVDTAGAIYVIGGQANGGSYTYYQDVWASTDGGARAGLRLGVVGAGTGGSTTVVLRGNTKGRVRARPRVCAGVRQRPC